MDGNVITLFPELTNPHGTRVETTWPEFFRSFAEPTTALTKEACPGWSPATFREDVRAKSSVETISAIVLDDDSGLTPLDAVTWPCLGLVHSSWSSTPEAPKHRTILPTSRPMTPAEHARVMQWAFAHTKQHLDAAVRDPSRLWFAPAARPGYAVRLLPGAPLDVDAALAQVPEGPVVPTAPATSQRTGNALAAIEWAKARAPALEGVPGQGGRTGGTDTFIAAQQCLRGFELDEDTAYQVLAEHWNPRCVPPWDEYGLRRKIREAAETTEGVAWGSMLPVPAWVQAKIAPAAPLLPAPPAPSAVRTLSDRIRTLPTHTHRIRTGLETLDRATRGGFLPGNVVCIAGAPGACKTGLVVDLARCWARQWARGGMPVTMLAFDEAADAIAVRIAQGEGFSRDALEMGDATAREGAAKALEVNLPNLVVVDSEDAGATIEEAAQALAARGAHGVLVVDSLQTARIAGGARYASRRDAIDAVLAVCKGVAKVHDLLVVMTSEVGRGSYRSKNPDEQVDDLSAAKESGGIEYAVTTELVMRSVKGGAGNLMDVSMPKNRLGPKLPFRLEMNPDRATITEVPLPDQAALEVARLAGLKEQILAVVRARPEHTPYMNKSDLAADVTGRKTDVLTCIKQLLTVDRRLEMAGGIRVK